MLFQVIFQVFYLFGLNFIFYHFFQIPVTKLHHFRHHFQYPTGAQPFVSIFQGGLACQPIKQVQETFLIQFYQLSLLYCQFQKVTIFLLLFYYDEPFFQLFQLVLVNFRLRLAFFLPF